MNVTIISSFDVNDHRVELLQNGLSVEGHQVSVLLPDFRHSQKYRRANAPRGAELLPAKPYYHNFSLSRIRSHVRFSEDAMARARALHPDVLWVLVPPNSLVKAAARYKKERPELKLVLDVMDLWPETMPVAGFSHTPPGWIWRNLRDRYLDRADVVVTESGGYWKTLQKSCDRRKLYTLYTTRDMQLRRLNGRPPADRIALCLLGRLDQYVDFPAVGRLVRECGYPVDLHVIGEGEESSKLRQTAESAGANVIFHGEVYSTEKKWSIFDRCHCGLNLLKAELSPERALKSEDYLKASMPVINNVRGAMWDFVERYPVGLNYDGGTTITGVKLLALQSRREQIQALYDTYFAEKIFAIKLRDIIQA